VVSEAHLKEHNVSEALAVGTNGKPVLRIGRKGRMTVAFGDEGAEPVPPFEIDVIVVNNQYLDLLAPFRNDAKVIPPERYTEVKGVTHQFVIGLTKSQDHPNGYAEMSMAESQHFITALNDAVQELELFFLPKSSAKPSSQGSTELRFSTE
jgi:hypothetical protein